MLGNVLGEQNDFGMQEKIAWHDYNADHHSNKRRTNRVNKYGKEDNYQKAA